MLAMQHRFLLPLALLALAGAAGAHVTVDPPEAATGSSIKAALRVGHGCNGQATHTLTVRLPEGFRGAKPMPKPGWTITITQARLAQPYDSHGRQVNEDVVEVSWRATTPEAALADAHYDEFVLRGQVVAAPGPLWLRVSQLCESGRWDWAELPASGTSTQGLKAPAVLLQVQPAAAAGHVH
jgi:uncharacterized protein YcnI